MRELLTFCFFYFAVLFMYSIEPYLKRPREDAP